MTIWVLFMPPKRVEDKWGSVLSQNGRTRKIDHLCIHSPRAKRRLEQEWRTTYIRSPCVSYFQDKREEEHFKKYAWEQRHGILVAIRDSCSVVAIAHAKTFCFPPVFCFFCVFGLWCALATCHGALDCVHAPVRPTDTCSMTLGGRDESIPRFMLLELFSANDAMRRRTPFNFFWDLFLSLSLSLS